MLSSTFQHPLIKKVSQKLIPLHCLFELTYKCNLKCIHCYIVKSKKRELNKLGVFKILEQLKKLGCLYLTLTGGEIFVRKDFFEIAEYARRLNFAIRLFTNGALINKEIANKIRDLKPISIEISLYGFRDTHEKVTRVKGSFDKTVTAIKLLRERNTKVFVKAIIMRQNIDEIWELIRFVENDLNVTWRGTDSRLLLFPCDDGDRRPLSYRLTDGQLREYMKEELKQLRFFGGGFKPKKAKDNEVLCGAGLMSCNISPYGEINPCAQIRLKKDNNLKNKSFMEIWKVNDEIKRLRSLRMKDRKDCWDCELISYCFVCPGIALSECGSLLAKLPEACRQARIRKEVYEENCTYHE